MNVFDLEAVIRLNKTAYEQGLKDARKQMEDTDKHTQQKTSSMSGSWQVMAVAIGNIVANVFGKVASTINGALDGAIARVDTLNNYSIVMEGLGYSADDAKNAVNKLSDGIQGLPTTLPGIVTVQKQFVSLLGNMDDATELTLALNNAVVAGGQGQEVANSALNQWYQILANGKPDLQSWRIINQAMPAQLDQLSKAIMGTDATANDLFHSWQDGTITTDQVKEAFSKLNTEGINGFANLQEQALNASKGIQTSMTNVKTAIVTQLGNIIQAMMDGGLDISGILDTTKGEIKGLGSVITESFSGQDFTNISNKIKDLIKMIFDALKKVDWKKLINTTLDAITKLVSFVTKHFKGILTLVKGIAAAFIGWKIGGVIQNIANGVRGLIGFMKNLIGAIKGTKGAQDALNASMNANPIGLIVTAITTLIAVMPDLIGYFKDWIGEKMGLSDLKEEIEEVKARTDELKSSSEQMQSTLKDGAGDADAQAKSLENLAEQLGDCVDENGNLKEGEEARAEYILGKLNEALGTEYSLNDIINGQYQTMTDNIKDLIEQQKLRALQSVYEQEYLEAIKGQGDALTALKDAFGPLEEARANYDIAMQAYAGTGVFGQSFIDDATEQRDTAMQSYQDALDSLQSYVEQQAVWETAQYYESQGWHDKALALMEDYSNGLGLNEDAQALVWQKMKTTESTYMGQMLADMGYNKEQITQIMNGMTDDMDIEQKIKTLGENGAAGFGDGFSSKWQSVADRVRGFFNQLYANLKHDDDQHSPSKRYGRFAKNQVKGLEKGWDDEFGDYQKQVVDDMNGLANYDFGELSASANMKANLDLQKQMNGFADSINMNMDALANREQVLNATIKIGDTTLGRVVTRAMTNQQYREIPTW